MTFALPLDWAAWEKFEPRVEGFVRWAEPAPASVSEERYAVAQDRAGVRWARVSPNPSVHVEYSPGCFYDIPEEGIVALERAAEAAVRHKRIVFERLGGTS